MTIVSSTHTLLCQILLGFLQAFLQEADISGCGRVLKPTGEAESCSFLLWFHGRLVQEVVGIDVVDLKPNKDRGLMIIIKTVTDCKTVGRHEIL